MDGGDMGSVDLGMTGCRQEKRISRKGTNQVLAGAKRGRKEDPESMTN